MDYKYINQLLDRYWQGETTLEEEQILRSFFSQLCVPEELAKYRPLFVYEQPTVWAMISTSVCCLWLANRKR